MVQAAIDDPFEQVGDSQASSLDVSSFEECDGQDNSVGPDEAEHSQVSFGGDGENAGEGDAEPAAVKPKRGRPPGTARAAQPADKAQENKVVKLLDKNPLGMTLPEMAGGPRQLKRIRTLRPILAEAIRSGLVMPVSQRAGHTVYRLVKHMGHR